MRRNPNNTLLSSLRLQTQPTSETAPVQEMMPLARRACSAASTAERHAKPKNRITTDHCTPLWHLHNGHPAGWHHHRHSRHAHSRRPRHSGRREKRRGGASRCETLRGRASQDGHREDTTTSHWQHTHQRRRNLRPVWVEARPRRRGRVPLRHVSVQFVTIHSRSIRDHVPRRAVGPADDV